MKTNKLFVTLVACLLGMATAMAQESPSKQINNIKRNSSYLYAEATMDSAEEALEVARELLIQEVRNYAETSIKFSDFDDVIVRNINAKSQSLSMMRGTMYRVFVYVKKKDLEAVSSATPEIGTPPQVYLEEQPVPQVAEPEPAPVAEAPVAAAQEQPVDEQPVVAPEATATTDAASAAEATTAADTDLPVWQQQAIGDLLECSDMAAVKAKLNRMKSEYKLKRYGAPDKCPDVEKAFWIIFGDDGSVSTVLGPGSGERVSFRDMAQSNLDSYKGKTALWFNFAK